MDLLDQVQADVKMEKKVTLFKYCLGIVVLLLAIICISVVVVHMQDKHNVEHYNQVSDLIVKLNENKELTAQEEKQLSVLYQNKKFKDVVHTLRFNKIFRLLNHDNTKNNRDALLTLLSHASKNEFYFLAQITWMNKTLDCFDSLEQKEKDTFLDFCNQFYCSSQIFFFRAKILQAMFYIKQNHTDHARQLLEALISDSNITESVQNEVNMILTTIK